MNDDPRFLAPAESDKSDKKGITKIFKWWNNTLAKLFGEEQEEETPRPDFFEPQPNKPSHGSPQQNPTYSKGLNFGSTPTSTFEKCICGREDLATFGPCKKCNKLMCEWCTSGRRGEQDTHPAQVHCDRNPRRRQRSQPPRGAPNNHHLFIF